MKAIYGKKLGMTRTFTTDGQCIPVTVLELGPDVVHQVKTKANDGYSAIQVGFGQTKPQRVNKPSRAHFAVAEKGMPAFVGEIRLEGEVEESAFKVGDVVTLGDMFAVGSKIDVSGTSSGKGFAGVIKRHNMAGFPGSHGTHEYFRHGGSIGNRKFPGRVFKNKRMPGHMGCDSVTQQGLTVVAVRAEENLLLVKGSVPGAKNSYVFVRPSVKSC